MSSILKVSNSNQDEEGSNPRVSLPSNSKTVAAKTTTLTATTITATLTKKTYHTKAEVDNSVSPTSPIPYTMTSNYDNNTVLAWLQTELTLYIDLHLIPNVRDFTHIEYWCGKPLTCLRHRFFPEAITDLLLELQQPLASTVFEDKLGLPPLKDSKDIASWFSQLKQALTQANNNQDDEVQEQLKESVLVPLTKLFQQAQELTRQESASTISSSSISQRSSPSPRIMVDETEAGPIKSRLFQLSSGCASESMEDLMQQALPIWKQWQEQGSASQKLRSSVEATYAALQLQLQKAQRNTSLEFASTVAYIRNELEFIQAKMIKTTTTDVGIHDLEVRSLTVGKLIETMAIQYKDMLEINEENETYTALVDKYRLIVAWVDEVRIWFVEAERIRGWIEERIHLLESRPLVSALDEVEFDYTMEEISALNEAHGKLEQEVQAFDAQDMTRLRAHVKALTSNNQKDLSPADTTTIEITFTTLMTLDRLMHLCRRHTYELQMQTLRMAWEQSYLETVTWVRATLEQVKLFVQSKTRWKPDEESSKTEIVNDLIQFEKQVSMFDQGQFTTTVNMYQDMDDASHVELPSHLESRQVAIEEAFEELTNRIAFARQVVEQFLIVTDFLEKAENLKHEGEVLRQEITTATDQSLLQANTTEFSEKVSLFQENTVRLVTTLRVPYPEATHPTDQQGNDEANEVIRMVMGARKSTLVLFGEALEQSLSAMRRSLQLQKRAKQLQDEMNRLAGWVDERLKAMEKVKVDEFFVAGKCGLDIEDLLRLQKERDGQVTKLQGIRDNEFKKLKENVQSIKQQHHPHNSINTHMTMQVNSLQEGLIKLGDQLDVLEEALRVHSSRLTILGQRIDWESQHAKASLWISNATFEVWDFLARKAQWRMIENDFQEEPIKQILVDLQAKTQAFKQDQLEPVHIIFEALIQGFESPALQLLLSQQDSTTSVLTQVQRRQDTLDQSFHNLIDLLTFTSQVLLQHASLVEFNSQASDLQAKGQQLVANLEHALITISNTTDNDARAVEEFSQAVVRLWMQYGSQIPYPTCPEDARATRPSTNDDEISTEIATAVYNTYTDLQALVKLLQDLLQHLQVVTAYKLRMDHWCEETTTTIKRILELTETVTSYSFDLAKGQVVRDQAEVSLDACQVQYRQLEEQFQVLSKTKVEPLKVQWKQLQQDLVVDACDVTVSFNEVTEEPLKQLENTWQVLGQQINELMHRMRVCQDRAAWFALWSMLWKQLGSIHENVLEWVNEKQLWLSKYEDDGSETGVGPLALLTSRLSQLDTDYKKSMAEQSLSLSTSYDSLEKSVQTLLHLKKEAGDDTLGHTEQQANLQKLASKLQDTLGAQQSELKDIQHRHGWQVRVDRLLQQCQEKETATESFIQSSARWSSSVTTTPEDSQKQLAALHKTTNDLLKEIGLLLQTEVTHQSEHMYRRRTDLSFTRDRLQQHDAFVDEVMAQHRSLADYFAQLASVEALAETTQSKLLSDDTVDPTAVLNYQKRVTDITAETPNSYPVRHFRDHNPQSRKEDESHNAGVVELIKARQARLVTMGGTLESLQKSKERLSRRKAAEASFDMEAGAIKDWIVAKRALFDQLKQTQDLKEATEAVNALQASMDTYFISSVQGLQAAYNQCVLVVQQQRGDDDDGDAVEKSLQHMAQLQKDVEAEWHALVKDVRETQETMTQKLRRAEFLQVVHAFDDACKELQDRVSGTELAEITEEVATQWENETNALALHLKRCSRDNDIFKEEDLQAMLDNAVAKFDDVKALIQTRTKEASHYRLKQQYFTGADALQIIMDSVQQSLLQVKEGPPQVMHGDDIKEDNALLAHITSTYTAIAEAFDTEHQEKYDEQRSFYRFLQLNKVAHLEQVDQRQEQLEQQWKQLKLEIAQAKQEAKMLAQWLALHEKLNEIKEEALIGIKDRLNQFEHMKDATVPSFLEQDANLLTLIRHRMSACLDITSSLDSKENLQAFQKRYDELLLDVSSVETLLAEKKAMALQHVEWVACQQGIEALCETAQLEKKRLIEMQHKVETFTQGQEESLDELLRQVSTAYISGEAAQQALVSEAESEWLPRLEGLANKDKCELEQKLATTKNELATALQDAAKTNDILRRVLGHNKSAENIQSWLANCKQAIHNLNTGDDEDDTLELATLSQKLKDFEPVIQSFMDLSKNLEEVSHKLVDDVVHPVTKGISQLWEETQDEYKQVEIQVKKASRGVMVARKMKHVVALIGELREYVHGIQLYDYDEETKQDDDEEEVDDDKTEVEFDMSQMNKEDKNQTPDSAMDFAITSTLTSLLRQNEIEDLTKHLKSTASDIQPQIKQEMKELDAMMREDIDTNFAHQYRELQVSVCSLQDALTDKYASLDKSLAIGKYLSIADDVDILQSSLEEALSQSSSSAPRHITQQHQSRTDLQAKLIELDARFKYYEQKIVQRLSDAKQQSSLVSGKGGVAVKAHLETMEKKWTWIKQQFKRRKIELSRTATSLDAENAMKEARIRKSSLPTRKATSLLRDRANNLDINPHRLSPTASLSGTPHRHRHISAGAMRLAPPQQLHQPSKSATQIKSQRPHPTKSSTAVKKVPLNSYVADPANDLDIEIGRIVNETPYRVKVKMVPGEVGRYWFGNLNPKLAYCRVLKSKMVMVRVGGGWTELSQFLRDHALLEGDFIPRHRLHNNKNNGIHDITEDQEPTSPSIQEGFIETHRAVGPTPKKNASVMTGSPSHSASTQGVGYKEGNKFIAVDHHGNQLEVQMRKATPSNHFMSNSSNSSTSTTNSTTTSNSQQQQSQPQPQQQPQHVNDYTKRRIARRKEKKDILNNTSSSYHSQSSNSSQSVNNK